MRVTTRDDRADTARRGKFLVTGGALMEFGDDIPLAYHLTFGTYGTRLHGDPRGTVDRSHNRPGDPIVGADPARWVRESAALRFPAVLLTVEQRRFAETQIPEVCSRGGWTYLVGSVAADHVHTMLVAETDGAGVRKWFKRWLGEALSARWPMVPRQSWWAEGGSVRWIWKESYFDNVYEYIRGQRTTPES
jgi:REP element-mobilizing transposase RayT